MSPVEQMVEQLMAIGDPAERARTAHRMFSACSEQLRDVRDLAINELRFDRKLSLREIAELLSTDDYTISKSRISDIVG